MRQRYIAVLATIALALSVAACGSDADESSDSSATSAPAASTTIASTTAAQATDAAPTTAPEDGDDPELTPNVSVVPVVAEMEESVLQTHAALAHSHYSAAADAAADLKGAIDAFVADPTDATLVAARQAWLDARPPYLMTEGFRFSDGPIDSAGIAVEGFINAWPLDEVYVDSLIAGEDAISEEMLRNANESGGERNISTGWHAIEYLLWGVDEDPAGPGDRPASDFVGDETVPTRMREYLSTATEMLVADISLVRDAWTPETGSYLETFFGFVPGEGLRRVMSGIGTMAGGELFGERLAVPYDTKDSEEEHSCFSDNTHVDHATDAASVRAIYLGLDASGEKVGPSVADLVAAADAALDERIRAELDAAVAATEAIPAPFDQAILGADTEPGRVAIKAAMDALDVLTQDIIEAGRTLGVQVGTEVP